MSRGLYQVKPPLPFVPGVEVAGTVRSAPAASGFTAGETVMAFTMLGGFAEVATADAAVTRRVPQQLSAEAAAGFLMNYHTAHFALARRAHVRGGETVAVHGAGGGVGTAGPSLQRRAGRKCPPRLRADPKALFGRVAVADSQKGDFRAQFRDVESISKVIRSGPRPRLHSSFRARARHLSKHR